MLERLFSRIPWLPVMAAMPFFMLMNLMASMLSVISWLWSCGGTKESHARRVAQVQREVGEWRRSHSSKLMCTARPEWKSISPQKLTYKAKMHGIHVDLDAILELDEHSKVVTVEPMLTIGRLNDYLINKGWTVPVVPELDDLTIGGLVMGGGIETTSHKHGLFQHCCRKYEVVLSTGEVVWCSPEDRAELFMAMPFSYGTLGFLTAVTLDIVEFRPLVHMKYYLTKDMSSMSELVKELCNDDVDSVEAFVFSESEAVVMAGVFKDEKEKGAKVNPVHRWYKPWFHHHARAMAKKKKEEDNSSTSSTSSMSSLLLSSEEWLPTRSFFHRHNRSCFWVLDYVFPSSFWFRLLFGWTLPPSHSLLKFVYHTFFPKYSLFNFLAQDFVISIDKLEEALKEIDEVTQVYPIWICPIKHKPPVGLDHLTVLKRDALELDVGIYGFTLKENYDKIASQRRMERFFIDRGGYVALYAETELDMDDLADMMGDAFKLYERMRKEYHCNDAFPHLYDKISNKGRKRLI